MPVGYHAGMSKRRLPSAEDSPRPASRGRTGAAGPSSGRGAWLAAGLAALVALLAYLPTLGAGFVWDDVNFIVENPLAQRMDGLATTLRHGYGWLPSADAAPDASLYFRPVVTVANTVQWVARPGDASGFHLWNAIAHAGTAACLVGLAVLLGVSAPVSAAAGILFAVHPAYSEAVAWISGRTDVFAACFGMLALLAAARAALPATAGAWSLPLFSGALLLALLSKESAAAVVPGALWLAWRSRASGSPDGLPRARRLLLALAGTLSVYVLLRLVVLGPPGSAGTDLGPRGNLFQRILQSGALYATYWQRLLVPWPLAPEPPDSVVVRSLSGAHVAVGLLMLAMSFVLLRLWLVPRKTEVREKSTPSGATTGRALGLLLFLAAIGPVLQWIPTGEIYGERFLYLPAAGLFLIGAFGLEALVRRFGVARPLAAAGLLAVVWLALLERRLPEWKTDLSLFSASVRVYPENARALANLGSAKMKLGDLQGAEPLLAKAARLDPEDARKRAQYGSLLVNLGRVDEGVAELEWALPRTPHSRTLLKNLGIGRTRQGRAEDATEVLRQALALDPNDAGVLEALAMARRKASDHDEAVRLFEEAIAHDPARKAAYLNLISILVNERPDRAAAIQWADRFLARFPAAPEAASVRAMRDGLR